MAITKDLVIDYGADPTGAVDAQPQLNSFETDMAGEDATLNIPIGSYKLASSGGQLWATGMISLVVNGNGAEMFEAPGGGPNLGSNTFQPAGLNAVGGKSARIQSVSAGSISVDLTAASASAGHISRAVVGTWMIVAGYDIQGEFLVDYGYPPNWHFLDFVKITGISGDTISFTPALQNSYSSEWPELNNAGVDSGGPASVFFLHADFGSTAVFNDLVLTGNNLIKCEGYDFTINGGESTNQPVYPTLNKRWVAINHDASAAALVEHDKLCDMVIVQGGSYTQWHCQSSSTNLLTMDGVALTSLNGTVRNTYLDNCTISGDLKIGSVSYGRADSIICRNTSIGGNITNGGISQTAVTDYMSMSGGIITIPKSMGSAATRLFAPDPSGRNVLFWVGNSGYYLGSFKVLAVTSDAWPAVDNQSITTNVTIANASKNLQVSSSIFSSGDVGKVIIVGGAVNGGFPRRTWITGFTSATQVTLYHPCTVAAGLSASSQTVQWGTCNVYIHTDQSGGFLPSSLWSVAGLKIQTPPVRTAYFENVTGSALAVDLSQVEARNKPLYSYTKRNFDGTNFGAGTTISLYGNIVSIKINVITPYTGVQGTLTCGLSQNNNVKLIQGSSFVDYAARVNLKISGERVITIGNTTGTQAGDTSLNLSATSWSAFGISPSVSADITGESSSVYPSFTVEVITDQGFYTGSTAVAPLWLRLRSA